MANTSPVLIVHGEPLVRLGLRTLVEGRRQWSTCSETSCSATALTMAEALHPTLVLLDLDLPHGDGIVLIKDLHRHVPGACLLVVTRQEDTESVQRAFRAGASGYVTTHDDPAEMLAALDAMKAGHQFASRRVSHALVHELSRGTLGRQRDADVSSLSNRELQIFRLIGRGMTSTAIARELCVSAKTIETHRRRMKDKLHVCNGAQLAQRAAHWAAVKKG